MFTSYAQNFEDLILWRALQHVENGFYIDIGANDPFVDSVSRAFHERGWHGLSVEPDPEFASKLRQARDRDCVVEAAITNSGRPVLLHLFEGMGLTTSSIEYANLHHDSGYQSTEIEVVSRTLESLFEQAGSRPIHWLKVDVEGMEKDVLESWRDHSARPWIVVVEATEPNTMVQNHETWEHEVLQRGYSFAYFDGLNRFYIHQSVSELNAHFSVGPNIHDGFCLPDTSGFVAPLHERILEQDQLTELLGDLSKSFTLSQNRALAAQAVEASSHRIRLSDELAAMKTKLVHSTAELERAQLQMAELDKSYQARLDSERAKFDAELERVQLQMAEQDKNYQARLDSERAKFDVELERVQLQTAEQDKNYQACLGSERAKFDAELERVQLQMVEQDKRFQACLDSELSKLDAMYQSTSWRLTSPLRATKRTAVAASWAPKVVIRSALGIGLRIVRTSPMAKTAATSLVRYSPRLRARLVRFGQQHPDVGRRKKNKVDAPPEELIDNPPAQLVAVSSRKKCDPIHGGDATFYVYVDHTIGCEVNTGVQRVVRGISRGLLQLGHRVVFVKWSEINSQLVKISTSELEHLSLWNGPDAGYGDTQYSIQGNEAVECLAGSRCWLVVPEVTHMVPRDVEPMKDILIAAKKLKFKSVVIYYDAIPLRRKEFASVSAVHEEYMKSMLLADVVLPISNWSARDLASFFRYHELADPDGIPTIAPILLPSVSIPLLQGQEARAHEKIILSVGTIEQRKNQHTLIEAFNAYCNRTCEKDWRLVLVGNLHADVANFVLDATGANPRISYLGALNDDELSALYRKCAFTVFPSIEEGFGLPIVESLEHGKPCVCANFGAMLEVATDGGCVTTDVADAGELATTICELTDNPDLLDRLSAEARGRESRSWSDYCHDFLNVMEQESHPAHKLGTVHYYVDQTCQYEANTGIQRVVRALARSLVEQGVKLAPVKWDIERGEFSRPSDHELAHLSNWNGPSPNQWEALDESHTPQSGEWLLIPEVISAPDGPQIKNILKFARAKGLRIAWIFYDAIPWKMRELYPDAATRAHGEYMEWLNGADLVLSISNHSNNDLRNFLLTTPEHTPNLFERLRPVLLPGEFPESERVKSIKVREAGQPLKILTVGTVEPRKNHLTLLRAFRRAQEKLDGQLVLELVIAGGAPFPDLKDEVEKSIGAAPGIEWVKGANDKALRRLYSECDFTVYPSLEEGFGLPILESLWNARPCICRNASSMREIASGGGCFEVDTSDENELTSAIVTLAENGARLKHLADEAVTRQFKTWKEYGREVADTLANERFVPKARECDVMLSQDEFTAQFENLASRPLLSVAITTYNRADWLAVSLENMMRLLPVPRDDIEIVVCDNASQDHTPDVMEPYLSRPDVSYHRNKVNVGMLGNLRETASKARGRYIWVIGDDDLVMPGALESIVKAIKDNRDAALIYLNYAYTHEEDPRKAENLTTFFATGKPITAPTPNRTASIAELSTLSENFFTAIYCLVFRRDHALQAYTQDTSGLPFTSMKTCIPTTAHVLNKMMHLQGVWLGSPQILVNMNVSWLKYAPLWILERIPEAFDTALKMGANSKEIDEHRRSQIPGVLHWFDDLLNQDPEQNRTHFNFDRFYSRFKHLAEFQAISGKLVSDYEFKQSQEPDNFSRSSVVDEFASKRQQ